MQYTVHFASSNPQQMRLSLPYTPADEKVIIKIYYQNKQRLQVFVGDRYVEDLNTKGGRPKKQLVIDGKWAPNDGHGGYAEQLLDLDCACQLGTETFLEPGSDCKAQVGDSPFCESTGNVHGANRWNRDTGMLEIVVGGHEIDQFILIKTSPVMALSSGLSVGVADFYKVKDRFIRFPVCLRHSSPARLLLRAAALSAARP